MEGGREPGGRVNGMGTERRSRDQMKREQERENRKLSVGRGAASLGSARDLGQWEAPGSLWGDSSSRGHGG